MHRLVIATNNAGKVDELRELLDGCGWQIVAPSELGLRLDPEETGLSYSDNARIKAQAFAAATGLAALADDSGLDVDALNGEPGVLHHLNGWDGADQADRIAILLRALQNVPPAQRTGRYHAVIVVAMPDGRTFEAAGACEGLIIDTPQGNNGFGYDPVFYLPGQAQTMAQLSAEAKNAISHRGIAVREIRAKLQELAAE
jgi:non-canonical purine NTP pyrophosphatase (RdgB/HAM1 family)